MRYTPVGDPIETFPHQDSVRRAAPIPTVHIPIEGIPRSLDFGHLGSLPRSLPASQGSSPPPSPGSRPGVQALPIVTVITLVGPITRIALTH